MLEVLKCLEHRSELARAKIFVKTLCKTFEVDVGGIHVAKELDPRLRRDIARAYRHRLNSPLAAGLRHVHRIFKKDHGIVVGKGDGSAAASHCRFCNRRGRGHVLNTIKISGLGDVPVLAELACQIAAGSTEGQDRRTRQK